MTRLVQCKKYNQQLEGLEKPPFPGSLGQSVYEEVSKKAWDEWLAHQTRLINEKQLKLFEPSTRSYLQEQMIAFLDNKTVDQAEGYKPLD